MSEFHYSPELALELMGNRLGQVEHDNAILRAALSYYQAEVQTLQTKLNLMANGYPDMDSGTFATVPYSDNGAVSPISR